MSHLPRAVHLVAQAPIFHVVRLLVTVRPSQLAPPGAFLDVAILDIGNGVFGCAGTEIKAEQRLGVHPLAPLDELVRAELIRLDGIPGSFQNGWPFFLWPDAILPLVAGDKISPRISYDRHAELLDLCDDVFAKSLFVGEL